MKKLFLATIAMSLLSFPAAFAQNLGALSSDAQPERLIPSAEFTKFLASNHKEVNTHQVVGGHKSDLWDWYGYGGYGGYYGSYYPYSYYGYGSYYPYYGYGYGYSYPYYGYGYGYWLDDQNAGRSNVASSHAISDAGHVPVVCFASDSTGNWYAGLDIAQNAEKTQHSVNQECSGASGSCVQNLGCALAVEPTE